MSEKTNFVTALNDGIRIEVTGEIDETCEIFKDKAPDANVYMDLSKIGKISASGIESWVRWINTCYSGEIIYQNCPPHFVERLRVSSNYRCRLVKNGTTLIQRPSAFSPSQITAPSRLSALLILAIVFHYLKISTE